MVPEDLAFLEMTGTGGGGEGGKGHGNLITVTVGRMKQNTGEKTYL